MKKIILPFLSIISIAMPVYAQSNRGIGNIVPASPVNEARTALVIGNAAYSIGPLRNPVNDARAVAAALRQLGFTVLSGENLTNRQMEEKILEFGVRIKKGGVGLFYYSGHGVQVQDANYLIPVGANIQKEQDVRFEAVPADRVLSEMEAAENRLNIVILDACRDNPFARSFRTASRGLAQMTAPYGTIIEYATAKGSTASDGTGANGLFTEQLVQTMKEPGLKIEEVFKQVRYAVKQNSGGEQVPWESSNLLGDFYFIPPGSAANVALPPGSSVDLGRYESEASRIAVNRSKWETWQNGMASAYRKAQSLDQNADLPTSQKAQMWGDFLNGYQDDNPYGSEDESLRDKADGKRSYWLAYQPPASPAMSGRRPGLDSHGIEFIFIPRGTFQMGDVFGDNEYNDEKPVHTVTVSDFYLGKTEVTVAQYRAFCNATNRAMPSAPGWGWQDSHPIVNVSWNDAAAFCAWAGCRLPTEAEWEYAAREGGKRVRFGNGKDIADPAEINFDGNAQYKKDYSVVGVYRGQTMPVASFSPNALGLYDMSGNAWEWCADWYGENYYGASPSTNPQGPSSGTYRVLRGGSWDLNPGDCRASDRRWYLPDLRGSSGGFRVSRTP